MFDAMPWLALRAHLRLPPPQVVGHHAPTPEATQFIAMAPMLGRPDSAWCPPDDACNSTRTSRHRWPPGTLHARPASPSPAHWAVRPVPPVVVTSSLASRLNRRNRPNRPCQVGEPPRVSTLLRLSHAPGCMLARVDYAPRMQWRATNATKSPDLPWLCGRNTAPCPTTGYVWTASPQTRGKGLQNP